ncbi:unnamed protein product [Agarophyton chilense]
MVPSILIIGANGRTGQNLIQAALAHEPAPIVHAFVRNPDSLPPAVAAKCASVQKGDALQTDQVRAALAASDATHLVVAIGVPNDLSVSTLRTDSAKAIVQAIENTARDVNVVVVSSLGAGGSSIKMGFGIGMFVGHMLRNVLRDHDGQEECFNQAFEHKKQSLLIVRPTNLIDGHPGKQLLLFDGQKKTPSSKTDRRDLADWIITQIFDGAQHFGNSVNITAAP